MQRKLIYVGLYPHVHRELASLRGAAHRQLLDRAAEAGEPMPLEVGYDDHLSVLPILRADLAAFEMAAVYRDFVEILAGFAVRYHDRQAREAVCECEPGMAFALPPRPGV